MKPCAGGMSSWGHPQCPIEPDGFAVEHAIVDDSQSQAREFVRLPQSAGVGDAGAQGGSHVLGEFGQQRSVKCSRSNGAHSDLFCGQVSRGNDGHADNSGL